MSEPSLSLSTAESGRILLSGDITHHSVLSVIETDIMSNKSPITIDFSGVNRSDSSGLALMTRWARQARAANVEIKYEDVPPKLAALAKMSGLDSILSISVKNS